MKKTLLFIATLALLATACNNKKEGKSNVVFDENHMISNECWMKLKPSVVAENENFGEEAFNNEVFKFNIDDKDAFYSISVTLCYDTSLYREKSFPLVVKFFNEENERHGINPTIRLIENNGTRRGQTVGKYCTITEVIDSYRQYNTAGTYTYYLRQGTSNYELHGISSVGLKVEKVNQVK
ncbi:MAG: hypothetical protein J6X86_01745 [Bacteroidales bacterium]|nr:hypothetical protein [Bacteroidales bacterium]